MKLILINNKNNYFESIYVNASTCNHDLFEKLKNDDGVRMLMRVIYESITD